MGNWRTVNITGTFAPAEVDPARQQLTVDLHDMSSVRRAGPLSISDGLCSLGEWPAPTVMATGNLLERDYTVEDVAAQLQNLQWVAPSMRLKVHCGDVYEDTTCVATITVADGRVTVGDPEVPTVAAVADDLAAGRLLKAITRQPE